MFLVFTTATVVGALLLHWWNQYQTKVDRLSRLAEAGAINWYYAGELDENGHNWKGRGDCFYEFVRTRESSLFNRDMFFSVEGIFFERNPERPLRNEDLALLTEFKELKYLSIEVREIDDGCIQHLEKLKGLRQLMLWQTSISPKGRDRLAKALPDTNIHYRDIRSRAVRRGAAGNGEL